MLWFAEAWEHRGIYPQTVPGHNHIHQSKILHNWEPANNTTLRGKKVIPINPSKNKERFIPVKIYFNFLCIMLNFSNTSVHRGSMSSTLTNSKCQGHKILLADRKHLSLQNSKLDILQTEVLNLCWSFINTALFSANPIERLSLPDQQPMLPYPETVLKAPRHEIYVTGSVKPATQSTNQGFNLSLSKTIIKLHQNQWGNRVWVRI